MADLLELLGAWGSCSNCNDCPADLTDDCIVGVADLLALLAEWGECDEPSACLSHLMFDCYRRFNHDTQDFMDCVEWVDEHGTVFPDP